MKGKNEEGRQPLSQDLKAKGYIRPWERGWRETGWEEKGKGRKERKEEKNCNGTKEGKAGEGRK